YGAQGANGVVIITTKQGMEGAIKVSAKVEGGIRQNIDKFDIVSSPEYIRYYQEALNLSDQGALDFANSYGYAYDNNAQTSIDNFPTFDWQDAIYRTGGHQGYSLTVSGGSEKTQFYTSGSYDKTVGTIKASDF